MTAEDGSALRRIAEATDLSYKVAPGPSQQRRMKLEAWDCLSLRMKSSAVVFEVFKAFARESILTVRGASERS